MPSLNMPVQRLKVEFLPLDLPCSGPVIHSREILTTGECHGKKPDRFSLIIIIIIIIITTSISHTRVIEHVIAECSSLSEAAYLGRHNQLAKIIHQQITVKCMLLDRNSPPYCRYKSEPMLESADMILYWDRPIVTDETIDFSRTDTVFNDRENTTALVRDIAVPLTHNRPNTETEKIMKYENLALQIKNIWKLNNVSAYPLVILAEGVVIKSFLKYVKNNGSIKNLLRVERKAVLLPTCHTVSKFLGHAP